MNDALAIRRIARERKIHVLVNYETTWYPSNKAAYDEVRENRIGEIRRVVVHDGHEGPKEIGVQPEFLKWLTDPEQNGAGALYGLRVLWRRPDDVAYAWGNAVDGLRPLPTTTSRRFTRTLMMTQPS